MANSTSSNNLFCVVYRTGGTANFQWRRTVAMSRAEAVQAQADTARMGYRAMVVNYAMSMAVGLPEGWDA